MSATKLHDVVGADMQERVVEVVKERLPLAAQQAHSSVDDR